MTYDQLYEVIESLAIHKNEILVKDHILARGKILRFISVDDQCFAVAIKRDGHVANIEIRTNKKGIFYEK